MDDLNRDILYFLVRFLQKVCEYAKWNKMDSQSMGIVFAPCLMKPKNYTIEDLQKHSFTMSKVIQSLIDNFMIYFKNQNNSYGLQMEQSDQQKNIVKEDENEDDNEDDLDELELVHQHILQQKSDSDLLQDPQS